MSNLRMQKTHLTGTCTGQSMGKCEEPLHLPYRPASGNGQLSATVQLGCQGSLTGTVRRAADFSAHLPKQRLWAGTGSARSLLSEELVDGRSSTPRGHQPSCDSATRTKILSPVGFQDSGSCMSRMKCKYILNTITLMISLNIYFQTYTAILSEKYEPQSPVGLRL